MKSRYAARSVLVMLSLALAGCRPAQPATEVAPPATNTPPATETPPPTNTPSPTASATATATPTETPEPTLTPNWTATIAAKKTEVVGALVPDIAKELDKHGLSTDGGRLGWINKSVRIQLDSYGTWDWDVPDPELVVSDFVLHTEMTWTTTTGLAGCGLVFHATDDVAKGKQYELVLVRIQSNPLWSIDYYNRGKYQSSITGEDWLNARGLASEQGSTNRLTFIVEGSKFSTYANDERMGVYTDNTLKEGRVAFMAHQESGKTMCEFKNSWLWVLK